MSGRSFPSHAMARLQHARSPGERLDMACPWRPQPRGVGAAFGLRLTRRYHIYG